MKPMSDARHKFRRVKLMVRWPWRKGKTEEEVKRNELALLIKLEFRKSDANFVGGELTKALYDRKVTKDGVRVIIYMLYGVPSVEELMSINLKRGDREFGKVAKLEEWLKDPTMPEAQVEKV